VVTRYPMPSISERSERVEANGGFWQPVLTSSTATTTFCNSKEEEEENQ